MLRYVHLCGKVYESSDFKFLYVKPQQTSAVELSKIQEVGILVSTAAGKSIKDISLATNKARVIRIMPTITSRISIGITAVCYSDTISEKERHLFEEAMKPLRELMELEEKNFDAFTVLNSSGPAFVAFVLESFIKGANKYRR
ncbi:MAG: pyrroline-5-carboxylate reductase family protein [Fervidobacterium sp.]